MNRRICPFGDLGPLDCVCPCSPLEDVSAIMRDAKKNRRLTNISQGLTIGGTVNGDPVKVCSQSCDIACIPPPLILFPFKDIIKTAFENGINMFDEAEGYASGNSEKEL